MPKPPAGNHVNADEHGLHRQPTASPLGTVLRGGSFVKSIQDTKRRHHDRLRTAAVAAAAAIESAAAAVADAADAPPGAASDADADGFALPAATSRGTSPRLSEEGDPHSGLSRVNSPREDRGSGGAKGSAGLANLRPSDIAEALVELSREPTMLHSSTQLLPSPQPGKRYCIVLDLDETVVYGRDGELTARAHLKQLLRTLGELAEVVVWTAGERSYAKAIVREINTEGVIRHLVYRDDAWFNADDYTKDLRKLGRDTDYVLIVENTPDCVRENPTHGIIVSDFEGTTTKRDETLLKLASVVEGLVASGKPVPEYLPTCRMLRRQVVVNEAGTEIPIFFLSGRVKRHPRPEEGGEEGAEEAAAAAAAEAEDAVVEAKVVKANRDKRPRDAAPVTPTGTRPDLPTAAAAPPKAHRGESKDRSAAAGKTPTKSDPRMTKAAPVRTTPARPAPAATGGSSAAKGTTPHGRPPLSGKK